MDRELNNPPHRIIISGPSGKIPAEMISYDDGTYDVSYDPEEVGEHHIQVLVDGKRRAEWFVMATQSTVDPLAMKKGDDVLIEAERITVGLGWSSVRKMDLDASCMLFRCVVFVAVRWVLCCAFVFCVLCVLCVDIDVTVCGDANLHLGDIKSLITATSKT